MKKSVSLREITFCYLIEKKIKKRLLVSRNSIIFTGENKNFFKANINDSTFLSSARLHSGSSPGGTNYMGKRCVFTGNS
jgi:hypothetical protein